MNEEEKIDKLRRGLWHGPDQVYPAAVGQEKDVRTLVRAALTLVARSPGYKGMVEGPGIPK